MNHERISDKSVLLAMLVVTVLLLGAATAAGLATLAYRKLDASLDASIRRQQFQQDMQQVRALGGMENYTRYLESKKCSQ